MNFELFIALRYVKSRRKGLFAVVASVIGIAGVCIGVAALIVTLSIMNGFQNDIKNKILNAQAHILVYGKMDADDIEYYVGKIKSEKEVKHVAPFVLGQAILTYRDRSVGIIVKGVDVEKEFKVNNLQNSLSYGEWKNFASKPVKAPPALVLGEELAKNIGVWLGDEVVLVSPRSVTTSLGVFPKMKKFRVAGLVKTGYYEFDSQTAFASLSAASEFFSLNGGINGVGVKLDDIEKSKPVSSRLKKNLGLSFIVKTYSEMNKTLFSALKLEKIVMSLVLALIILVATFNIASNLILMSMEKLRDMGILRSIGARPSSVKKIFLTVGNIIALSGIVSGLFLGTAVSLFLAKYSVIELPADIYYITRVPVKIEVVDVALTALVSYVLCMASALYPALRASRINPVDAIRYG